MPVTESLQEFDDLIQNLAKQFLKKPINSEEDKTILEKIATEWKAALQQISSSNRSSGFQVRNMLYSVLKRHILNKDSTRRVELCSKCHDTQSLLEELKNIEKQKTLAVPSGSSSNVSATQGSNTSLLSLPNTPVLPPKKTLFKTYKVIGNGKRSEEEETSLVNTCQIDGLGTATLSIQFNEDTQTISSIKIVGLPSISSSLRGEYALLKGMQPLWQLQQELVNRIIEDIKVQYIGKDINKIFTILPGRKMSFEIASRRIGQFFKEKHDKELKQIFEQHKKEFSKKPDSTSDTVEIVCLGNTNSSRLPNWEVVEGLCNASVTVVFNRQDKTVVNIKTNGRPRLTPETRSSFADKKSLYPSSEKRDIAHAEDIPMIREKIREQYKDKSIMEHDLFGSLPKSLIPLSAEKKDDLLFRQAARTIANTFINYTRDDNNLFLDSSRHNQLAGALATELRHCKELGEGTFKQQFPNGYRIKHSEQLAILKNELEIKEEKSVIYIPWEQLDLSIRRLQDQTTQKAANEKDERQKDAENQAAMKRKREERAQERQGDKKFYNEQERTAFSSDVEDDFHSDIPQSVIEKSHRFSKTTGIDKNGTSHTNNPTILSTGRRSIVPLAFTGNHSLSVTQTPQKFQTSTADSNLTFFSEVKNKEQTENSTGIVLSNLEQEALQSAKILSEKLGKNPLQNTASNPYTFMHPSLVETCELKTEKSFAPTQEDPENNVNEDIEMHLV